MPIPSQQPQRHAADYGDVAALQKRLMQAADKLSAMAGNVAMARHITTFDSDRRKRALAMAAAPLLAAGQSSAAAETSARSSPEYQAAMTELGKQYTSAEKVLVEFETTKLQWETARSLLAVMRDSMKHL